MRGHMVIRKHLIHFWQLAQIISLNYGI